MPLQYPVLYKSMDARADQAVANSVNTAIADATSLWNPEQFDGVFPTKGFGIAKLKASDVFNKHTTAGHRYSAFWSMSIATASTWETYFDVTLSDSCYFVITGIFDYTATPDCDYIKIIADGIEYPVIELTEMWGWDVATAYFSHPIVVRPEKKLVVKMKARTAGFKDIGFLGYIIAKRSYLIGEL